MPDGIVELAAGPARARLAPLLGGRITALMLTPGGSASPRDVLVRFPEDTASCDLLQWPKGGLYPLIPYGNRVRDGRLLFQGLEHALSPHPDAAPHTLHGHAHRKAWRLSRRDVASARMELDHDGTGEWPWRFGVRQDVTLSPGALVLALRLHNADDRPMPAGIGLHPYFLHHPEDRIGFRTHTAWSTMPDSLAGPPVPTTTSFDPPRPLPRGKQTLYLSGSDGSYSVFSQDNIVLRLQADRVFDHLVIHRPASATFLCIEPCSHSPDGFNMSERGISGAGRIVLAPGDALSGQVVISLSVLR